MGKPIIMGRKTFESVGRPLPGRPNIVITRQADYSREGLIVTASVQEALEAAKAFNTDEVFITGGSEIIAQALPSLVQRVYLTRVHANVEGDAYFPVLAKEQWKLVSSQLHPADEKHAYALTFEVWERV
jgi:dihydrofolate reductase